MSSSEISSEIEDMLRDMINNLPLKEYASKKSSVKFAEFSAPTIRNSDFELDET